MLKSPGMAVKLRDEPTRVTPLFPVSPIMDVLPAIADDLHRSECRDRAARPRDLRATWPPDLPADSVPAPTHRHSRRSQDIGGHAARPSGSTPPDHLLPRTRPKPPPRSSAPTPPTPPPHTDPSARAL